MEGGYGRGVEGKGREGSQGGQELAPVHHSFEVLKPPMKFDSVSPPGE